MTVLDRVVVEGNQTCHLGIELGQHSVAMEREQLGDQPQFPFAEALSDYFAWVGEQLD